MNDAIVISDLHLGGDNCQADLLIEFLHTLRHGSNPSKKLILNGDVFDSFDFRRLKKSHWKVLSTIRKLSDEVEIVWINGNHDGPLDIISHLLGVQVVDEYVIESGEKRILLLHGHIFDDFLESYPITTHIADFVYRILQKIDPSHGFARWAKQSSKTFLRCTEKIEEKSIAYAKARKCDVVCCGHTHLAIERASRPVAYYNSGCWTEKPCNYLTIRNGVVRLSAFDESHITAEPREHATLPLALAAS